jgi:hypothetical protein
MKQLLSLFLFLVPCLALAQYPSNGNQKITLGEQTTADGLIFRGVLGDTALITPLSDTSAYIILDTANHRFYNYNRATNVWSVAGGGTAVTTFSGGTTGLTPNTATSGAVTLGGTLAVANGGTGSVTQNFVDLTNTQTVGGVKTYTEPFTINNLNPITFYNATSSNRASGLVTQESGTNKWAFGTNLGSSDNSFNVYNYNAGTRFLTIINAGNVGIGTASPQSGYRLHVVDSVYVGGNVSAAAYTTRSDYNLKDDIFDLKYGLNDVLKLQPVEYTYKSNGSKQLGFIAQDIGTILPEVVSFEESMSVNYQAIIPILTKAIQEQQALIKALEQRIINLENK